MTGTIGSNKFPHCEADELGAGGWCVVKWSRKAQDKEYDDWKVLSGKRYNDCLNSVTANAVEIKVSGRIVFNITSSSDIHLRRNLYRMI